MSLFRKKHLCPFKAVSRAEDLDISSLEGIVVGSDQVWNSAITYDMDAAYWAYGLELPASCRLISYAASMGSYPPGRISKQKMASSLGRFDRISVREKDTSEHLLKDLSVTSTVSVDPVFLIGKEDLEALAEKLDHQEPYLLIYDTYYDSALIQKALEIARERHLSIIRLSASFKSALKDIPHTVRKQFQELPGCSVEQFLGCFIKASYLVTNSFHGLVLGLKFHHPFSLFPISHKDNRLSSLLEILELTDGEETFGAPVSIDPDEKGWKDLDLRMERKIQDSKQYLKDALL